MPTTKYVCESFVVTKFGKVVNGTLFASDFQNKTLFCDAPKFFELKHQIDEKLTQALDPTSNFLNLAFQMDMLAQEDAYVACKAKMLSKTTQKAGPELTYDVSVCLYDYVCHGISFFASFPHLVV